MIFMSPTLAFTSTLQVEASFENMVCCKANDVEDEELKDCCMMSDQEDATSCGDNHCNLNTCHFVHSSVLHVYFSKNNSLDHLNIDFIQKSKFDFYQSFSINDRSDYTWKPPKYISYSLKS